MNMKSKVVKFKSKKDLKDINYVDFDIPFDNYAFVQDIIDGKLKLKNYDKLYPCEIFDIATEPILFSMEDLDGNILYTEYCDESDKFGIDNILKVMQLDLSFNRHITYTFI